MAKNVPINPEMRQAYETIIQNSPQLQGKDHEQTLQELNEEFIQNLDKMTKQSLTEKQWKEYSNLLMFRSAQDAQEYLTRTLPNYMEKMQGVFNELFTKYTGLK